MDIVSQEATAYMRAADVAGVELPDAIVEARKNLEKIDAEHAAFEPAEKPAAASSLLASGMSLDEAEAEHARLKAAAADKEARRKTVSEARSIARRHLSRLCAEHRDELIHALRPVVADLVHASRPLAQTLAPFAPKYDAGAIARKAEPKQIKAWREAEALERSFGACIAAWRASFKADTAKRFGGFPSPTCPRDFDVRWLKEAHRYWADPDFVREPRLNGTYYGNPYSARPSAIQPTILAVAAEPVEAGFRLATVTELRDAYNAGAR